MGSSAVVTHQPGGLRVTFTVPGVLLGAGLGGFMDGILLHQILQWHHMATSAGESATTVGGLEANTLTGSSTLPPGFS
jgi:uncharacterized membrane protein